MPLSKPEEFAKVVTDGIAFPAKRQELKDELLEHMEDIYLQNRATGMDEEAAAENAVLHMGDPLLLRGTFARLYPMSPAKLVSQSLKALLWGIWVFGFAEALTGCSPYGYMHRIIAIALCLSGLYPLRKVSRRLNTAFWIYLLGAVVFVTGQFLQAFFVLSPKAVYAVYLTQYVCVGLISILLFWDFAVQAKKEKQERAVDKDEALHPLAGCIGMLSALLLLLGSVMLGGIMELGLILAVFAAIILLAVTVLCVMPADRLYARAETEERLRKPPSKPRIYSLVLAIVILCSIGGSVLSAIRQPKTQVPVVADCAAAETDVAAARAHMLSLGFPQDMLDDLPNSEVLRYKDALLMVEDSLQEDKLTDLPYTAYGFYLPETETQPYRLRYILCIADSEALNTRFRGALHVTDY